MIKTNYINEKLNCKKSLPTQKCLVTVLRQLPAANTYCALPRQLLTIRERRRSRSATCHMRPILGNSSSLASRTPFTNQQYAFAAESAGRAQSGVWKSQCHSQSFTARRHCLAIHVAPI